MPLIISSSHSVYSKVEYLCSTSDFFFYFKERIDSIEACRYAIFKVAEADKFELIS